MKFKRPIRILIISLILLLTNSIFSEEKKSSNKFSGNWIQYSRWGFEIKRLSETKEIIENYDDFGQLKSKKIVGLMYKLKLKFQQLVEAAKCSECQPKQKGQE